MTLEQQAWKERGGFGPSPGTPRKPTTFDWVARVAATTILVGLLAVSVWALTLAPVGGYLLGAVLLLMYAHLFFKVRDLAREVRALRENLDAAPVASVPP